MTDAELRDLLRDCLKLWEVAGKVSVQDTSLVIATELGCYPVTRAGADMRPVAWFYQTSERAAAGRPPRAVPSIVALLAALRNVMAGTGGDRLRVAGL